MAMPDSLEDPGRLANNGILVRSLQQALTQTEGLHRSVPKFLFHVVQDGAWLDFLTVEGQRYRWNAAEFRRFLEAPRPAGCQTSISLLSRILEGTEAWGAFQKAIRGERGAPEGHPAYPERGKAGRFETKPINRDDMTVNGSPPIIPLSPDTPRPRQRDYAREAPTGTSVSYLTRRLERQAPELYERVKAGEFTPHAAAVQAGFVDRKVTVPLDPARAARILVKHLQPAAVKTLIIELSNAAGFAIEHD